MDLMGGRDCEALRDAILSLLLSLLLNLWIDRPVLAFAAHVRTGG